MRIDLRLDLVIYNYFLPFAPAKAKDERKHKDGYLEEEGSRRPEFRRFR